MNEIKLDDFLPPWAHEHIFSLTKFQWIGLFVSIFLGLLVKTAAYIVFAFLRRYSSKRDKTFFHRTLVATERPMGLVCATGFWFMMIHALRFEGRAFKLLMNTNNFVFSIGMIWATYKMVDVVASLLDDYSHRKNAAIDDHLTPFIVKSLRLLVIIFGVLMTLQGLGFNVMSLVAGLGLGGLALALAAKDTAANFFGSVMILLDRPFVIGDYINTSGVEGDVEAIGFRSTRIRTIYDSVVIIPNSNLAVANIDNMGLRRMRRIRQAFGLTYDTSPEKLEAFLQGLQNIILAHPFTAKDRYFVSFDGFGESGLNVQMICFLSVPNRTQELYQQQNLFLEIIRLANRLDVAFAFPTRTLHVETFPEKSSSRQPKEFNSDEFRQLANDFGPNGKMSHPGGLGIFKLSDDLKG